MEAKSNSIAKSTYKLVPDITEFIDKYDGNEDLNRHISLAHFDKIFINRSLRAR